MALKGEDMNKNWKKGDGVKWKVGRALKYSRGKVFRHLAAGAQLKTIPGLVTKMDIGQYIGADSYVVVADDGTRRIVRTGYLKAV